MSLSHLHTIRVFSWGWIIIGGLTTAATAERNDQVPISFARQVTFKLTYAHQDLIWIGDAASPTALVYPKIGARPIATDLYIKTVVESRKSPFRRSLREARIAAENNTRQVYAFTKEREKIIGTIDDRGRFSANEFYEKNRELLPTWPADASVLGYDSEENALYYEVDIPGPVVSESLDFLPLNLCDAQGITVAGQFSIGYAAADGKEGATNSSVVSLTIQCREKSITLAKAIVPGVFRRSDVQLGSFDNVTGTHVPEAAYRAGAGRNKGTEPSITVSITGELTPAVQSRAESLVVEIAPQPADQPTKVPVRINIDGNFADWRKVAGMDDRRGDLVPYLEYVPDVDLLEFKVAHDDEHIYLYARVAGQVGRSHPDGGRSYFYAYMDVDQNPNTGFLPTRDDDCYYGVDIGDDCEVQFEFVDNVFRKSFYGFCGIGGDDNVLKQAVTIGASTYGRFDGNRIERANYKSEYIYRDGVTEITEDLKPGTSDTIQLAVSPDGSEVEIASTFTGFLKDSQGRPTVALGQTIDLAVGMECDSKAYPGKTHWAADSTNAIRSYRLNTSADSADIQRRPDN